MEPLYWLIAMAILLVVEIITLGLTTVWFAAGAFVTCFISLAGASWQVQWSVFVIVSILMFFFVRPSAVKKFNVKREKTNLDRLVGEKGKVLETIDNLNEKGVVLADGKEWTARSQDGKVIKEGSIVNIVEITGVKLIVTLMEEA